MDLDICGTGQREDRDLAGQRDGGRISAIRGQEPQPGKDHRNRRKPDLRGLAQQHRQMLGVQRLWGVGQATPAEVLPQGADHEALDPGRLRRGIIDTAIPAAGTR